MSVPDWMRRGGRSVISIAASNGIEGPDVIVGRHRRFQDARLEFPRAVLLDDHIVILAVENAVGAFLGVAVDSKNDRAYLHLGIVHPVEGDTRHMVRCRREECSDAVERSEERRLGKGGVSTCSTRGWP